MIKLASKIEFDFGRSPSGRAFRCNLFAKGKKDFRYNP